MDIHELILPEDMALPAGAIFKVCGPVACEQFKVMRVRLTAAGAVHRLAEVAGSLAVDPLIALLRAAPGGRRPAEGRAREGLQEVQDQAAAVLQPEGGAVKMTRAERRATDFSALSVAACAAPGALEVEASASSRSGRPSATARCAASERKRLH
jgi:hypothetical protein